MCIYNSPEESTEAFKKVWSQGYGNAFPTREAASIYAGGDRVDEWWTNVQKFYYQ